MKICNRTGNGMCINCDKQKTLSEYDCSVCRYDAEHKLDLLEYLLETNLSEEQKTIIAEWERWRGICAK